MPAQEVTSTTPYRAWYLTLELPDPADPTKPSVLDAFEAMMTIAAAGYKGSIVCYAAQPSGMPTVDVIVTRDGYPDQPAPPGHWIVFDGTYATVVDAATYAGAYAPVV